MSAGRSRRIELMPLNEDDAQPRQRLAAPALRRTGRVRTVEHLERNTQLFLQADKSSIDLFRGHRLVRDLRAPCESEQQPAFVAIAAKNWSALDERVVAPDDQRSVGKLRDLLSLERHDVDS